MGLRKRLGNLFRGKKKAVTLDLAKETKRQRKRIAKLEQTRDLQEWREKRLVKHTQTFINKGNDLRSALQALRDKYAHNWVGNERLFQKGLKERKPHVKLQASLIYRINYIDRLRADEIRLKKFGEKHRFRLPKEFIGKDMPSGFKVKTTRLIKLAKEAKERPEFKKWQEERLHKHVSKRMRERKLSFKQALAHLGEEYLYGLEVGRKEGYNEATLALQQAKIEHIDFLQENRKALKAFKKKHEF